MATTMRMIDRLKCVTFVELQRNERAKVFLDIDLRRRAAWMGSAEVTELSRKYNRFSISEDYVCRFGFHRHLVSDFFSRCRWVVMSAFFYMGAYEISEDLKGGLLDYVYNISRRVMHLPTKEIVIKAEIEILTVFQSQPQPYNRGRSRRTRTQPQRFNGGTNRMQPQPEVSMQLLLDESLMFTGDMTLIPSQSQWFDDGPRRSDQSWTPDPVFDGNVIHLDESLTSDSATQESDVSVTLDAVLQESMLLAEQRGFMTSPATTTAIENLETKDFKEEEEVSSALDNSTCAICFDRFADGTQLKRMPCMHVFHDGCIITWLKQSNSCPLCRFKL